LRTTRAREIQDTSAIGIGRESCSPAVDVRPEADPPRGELPHCRSPGRKSSKLRKAEVKVAQGATGAAAAKKIGVTEPRYDHWKMAHGANGG
jgi:hypothetical protein